MTQKSSKPMSQFIAGPGDTAELFFWGIHFDDALEALQLVNRRTLERRKGRPAPGIEAEGRNIEGGSVHESPSTVGRAPEPTLRTRTTDGGEA